MSYLLEDEAVCTNCQFPNKGEIWSIVNVRQDPELKDILLGGELNMIECQSCRKIFYAEKFLLYHDPDSELMAFVYPYEDRQNRAQLEQKTKDDFHQSQSLMDPDKRVSYTPVSLFGLDELVILIEKENEARIQGEIVKHMAEPLGLEVKTLSPSKARKAGCPTILPFRHANGVKDPKSLLLDALIMIENKNPLLGIYSDLRKNISASAEFAIPTE